MVAVADLCTVADGAHARDLPPPLRRAVALVRRPSSEGVDLPRAGGRVREAVAVVEELAVVVAVLVVIVLLDARQLGPVTSAAGQLGRNTVSECWGTHSTSSGTAPDTPVKAYGLQQDDFMQCFAVVEGVLAAHGAKRMLGSPLYCPAWTVHDLLAKVGLPAPTTSAASTVYKGVPAAKRVAVLPGGCGELH